MEAPLEDELPESPAVCVHRWAIAAPSGEVSKGSCRLCGAERDFPLYPSRKSAYIRVKTR